MEERQLFSETQKFRQWWIWILLLVIALLLISRLFFGSEEEIEGYLPGVIVLLIVSGLLYFAHLDTRITDQGVHYRFFPLSRDHFIPWTSIEKAEVTEYKPMSDFGGWGIRFSPGGKGRAYSISGKDGLLLSLKTKKRILLGTRRPGELRAVLNKISH